MALATGAAAVASASAVVYLALYIPIRSQVADAPVRRRASGNVRDPPVIVPLERRSRTHVVVRAHGHAPRGDGGTPLTSDVDALLDTAISLSITTPSGERRFGVEPGDGAPVPGRGFAGAEALLFPISATRPFDVSVGDAADPRHVDLRIGYLGVDAVAGADVIVPPHWLGPLGGAVSLDLARVQFATCDSLEACLASGGFSRVSDSACAAIPELTVVHIRIDGSDARLLLDTGGSTWLFKKYFDAQDLAGKATALRPGSLVGTSSQGMPGTLVQGHWTLAFGSSTHSLASLWVIAPTGGAAYTCSLDGSIGIDALDGCTLVLADGAAATAYLRCEG
jgi:hypothetical protein